MLNWINSENKFERHSRNSKHRNWCVCMLKKKKKIVNYIISDQISRSVMSDSLRPPWIAARQASLSITNSRSSHRLTSIESVMPSSHLILCRPLIFLPPTPPSIRVFSNESTLRMRWPKDWSFSFSIIPAKEHPGLISCREWSIKLSE